MKSPLGSKSMYAERKFDHVSKNFQGYRRGGLRDTGVSIYSPNLSRPCDSARFEHPSSFSVKFLQRLYIVHQQFTRLKLLSPPQTSPATKQMRTYS